MSFRDMLQADMDVLINTDVFAEAATYQDPSGTNTSISVVLHPEMTETQDTSGIKTKLRIRDCTWDAATLSDVNLRATICVNSQDWAIADLVYQDDEQVTVRLERHELMEQAKPNYRRR